ncbi:MAG: Rrf2 family transcriptional regulator [Ectothiorhodospiraceae bacterium AqS1]|nr:Rrf2 family transcriptional regulator [Ectothiorhodospiraceae bacterium AqS1]
MRLTAKSRYAVTAMLDLALHHDQGSVSLGDIARRQGISLSFLERLFAQLRSRGLVSSIRGPGGGYRLGLAPESIAIADVIDAVDESVDSTHCRGKENCRNHERCLTHDLWTELGYRIEEFLAGIDLAQLVERCRAQETSEKRAEKGSGKARDVGSADRGSLDSDAKGVAVAIESPALGSGSSERPGTMPCQSL